MKWGDRGRSPTATGLQSQWRPLRREVQGLCEHVTGLTLCPSPAQVLLLEAAERPSGPDNDLPVPQSSPPPWNEDFLPDAIPLAHPGPQRRRPTGPAGE